MIPVMTRAGYRVIVPDFIGNQAIYLHSPAISLIDDWDAMETGLEPF